MIICTSQDQKFGIFTWITSAESDRQQDIPNTQLASQKIKGPSSV